MNILPVGASYYFAHAVRRLQFRPFTALLKVFAYTTNVDIRYRARARRIPLSCRCNRYRKTGAGLIAGGTPQQLGKAISSLLADIDRTRYMGEIGCRVASWAAMSGQMKAALMLALKERQGLNNIRPPPQR
jgi:hypothetical protein